MFLKVEPIVLMDTGLSGVPISSWASSGGSARSAQGTAFAGAESLTVLLDHPFDVLGFFRDVFSFISDYHCYYYF